MKIEISRKEAQVIIDYITRSVYDSDFERRYVMLQLRNKLILKLF